MSFTQNMKLLALAGIVATNGVVILPLATLLTLLDDARGSKPQPRAPKADWERPQEASQSLLKDSSND